MDNFVQLFSECHSCSHRCELWSHKSSKPMPTFLWVVDVEIWSCRHFVKKNL